MAPSMNSYLECLTTSLDNQNNFPMNHIQTIPPQIYNSWYIHSSTLFPPLLSTKIFLFHFHNNITLYSWFVLCNTSTLPWIYRSWSIYTPLIASYVLWYWPKYSSSTFTKICLQSPIFFFVILQPYLGYIALEKYALQYTSHHSISAIFLVI